MGGPVSVAMDCPNCGAAMVLRQSRWDGRPRNYYSCAGWPKCDTGVGARDDGSPLGIPADKATRQARIAAHHAFDAVWQNGGRRARAYRALQQLMGLSRDRCHIACFDAETCRRVIAFAESGALRRRMYRGSQS